MGSQDGDDLLLGRLYSTSTLPAAAPAEELPVQDDGGGHLRYPPPEMGTEGEQAAEAPQPGFSRQPSSTQAPGRRQAQEVPAERLVARQPSAMQGALAPGTPWAAGSPPAGQPSTLEGGPAPGMPRAGHSPLSRQVSRAAAEIGGLQSADVNESAYDDAVWEAASPAREDSRRFLEPGPRQPGSSAEPGADLGQPEGVFWTSTEGKVSGTQASCRMPSCSKL